jgi:hypothetical protein
MKLTYNEIEWINIKLNSYDIKFQEIYDDLEDHLINAIESLRTNGDQRPVKILYQEVVRKQFPGFGPFDDIVKQYQTSYRKKINDAVWTNFRHYLNRQTLPVLAILIIASFYMPRNKATALIMMTALFLAAIILLGYGYLSGRKTKTDKGRQSLVRNQVLLQSSFLVLVVNIVFNVIGPIGRNWKPAAFLNPVHYAPIAFALLIGFFLIYSLSCIRLIRRKFKLGQ